MLVMMFFKLEKPALNLVFKLVFKAGASPRGPQGPDGPHWDREKLWAVWSPRTALRTTVLKNAQFLILPYAQYVFVYC